MSFDIFLHGFDDTPNDGSAAVRAILEPILSASRSDFTTADGSASVYGLEHEVINGLMFNHVDGDDAWDVIYAIAVAGGWAIMPIGCPVCLTNDDQFGSLPEHLQEPPPVLVTSGADIRAVIRSA